MRSSTYDVVAKLVHLLLRLFFRRVEVTGLELIVGTDPGMAIMDGGAFPGTL